MYKVLYNSLAKICFNHKLNIMAISIINFIVSIYFFQSRELMSEFLVVNTIDLNYNLASLEWVGLYFYDNQPYTSLLGFQGFIFSIISFIGIQPSESMFYFYIFINTIFFNWLLYSIFILLKNKYNMLSAMLFIFPFLVSTFYWFDSGNLYWMYSFFILPFFISMKYYRNVKFKYLLLMLFIAFLIKFSFGFEYIILVVISAFIPIIIDDFSSLTSQLKKIFKVGLISIIAFLLIFSKLSYNVSSLHPEKNNLKKLINSYVVGGDNKPHFLKYDNYRFSKYEMYGKFINSKTNEDDLVDNEWNRVIEHRKTYKNYSSLLGYFNFNSKKAAYYSLQLSVSLFFLFLITLFGLKNKNLRRFIFASWVSLFGAVIWILIMPMHFYLHSIVWRGVSDIIFLFPFYSILGLLVGQFLKEYQLSINNC